MSNDFQSFRISVSAATEQQRTVQLKLDALNERINSIIARTEVGGHPGLLGAILNVSRKKEELIQLSKSLARVAELIVEYEDLEHQKHFLDLLVNRPRDAAALAGDFSGEWDDIEQHLKGQLP